MIYTLWDKEFDNANDAERLLSAMFSDMCQDIGIDYGNDDVAWRECFNNWTDAICKDGLICEASYSDLCPIGERFE